MLDTNIRIMGIVITVSTNIRVSASNNWSVSIIPNCSEIITHKPHRFRLEMPLKINATILLNTIQQRSSTHPVAIRVF